MERHASSSRGPRRGPAPRWLIGAGLALSALAVVAIVAPTGRAPSASSSIAAGDRRSPGAELTAALRTESSVEEVAGTADVQIRGLGDALEARPLRKGRVVVEYRADADPSQLRAVTVAAARLLARVIVASDVAAAEREVADAEARGERADAAIADHQASTGVADPDSALADSKEQLSELQTQRDQAVAAGSPSAAVLEQRVAEAQQEMFDLEAVATRRADLVEERERAVGAAEAADATRQAAIGRVGSVSEAVPAVTVSDPALPAWRVALSGVFALGAVTMLLLGVVALVRARRAPARSRPAVPAARPSAGSADVLPSRAPVRSAAPPSPAPPAPAPPPSPPPLVAPPSAPAPAQPARAQPASPSPVAEARPPAPPVPAPSPGLPPEREVVRPEVTAADLSGKPRIELDEIERRLAALQARLAAFDADADDGPRIDQRT